MAKQTVLRSKEGAALALLFILVLNYACAMYGWKPFLYCYGRYIAWAIYIAMANILNVLCLFLFGMAVFSGSAKRALMAGFVLVLVMGMPTFADILFRAGGSCG